jgi:pimeloyl-ACP methyl ester carboxylesterase
VIGCGVGGIIALQLAAAHPEMINAIILCESSPDLSPQTITQEAMRAEIAASLGGWAQAEQALHGARLILRDDAGHPREDWDPAAAPSLARSLGETKPWPLFEAARGKPVLALRGAASPTTSKDAFDAMARRKSDLKCVSIAGSPDARRFDEPETLKAITGFLAGLS